MAIAFDIFFAVFMPYTNLTAKCLRHFIVNSVLNKGNGYFNGV